MPSTATVPISPRPTRSGQPAEHQAGRGRQLHEALLHADPRTQPAMMLDYFAYTDDLAFVKETPLPIAEAGITFFDQHFPHEGSKRLLDPDNAIEMYWTSQPRARYRRSALGAQWTSGLAARVDDRGAVPSLADDPRHRPGIAHGREERQQAALPAEKIDNGHNSENPDLRHLSVPPVRPGQAQFGFQRGPRFRRPPIQEPRLLVPERHPGLCCWAIPGRRGRTSSSAHAQGQAMPSLPRVLGSWLGLTCPTRTTAVTA